MTTKNTGKSEPAVHTSNRPGSDETRSAYLVHTLAQMLYGRMALVHPWLAAPYPVSDPYAASSEPYASSTPYAMPSAPYATANVPFAVPKAAYAMPQTSYAMPNVLPQAPFGFHFSGWSPFFTA